MAGPKSRIVQKGLGALGNIYDQLNLARFGKGDKPYPEPEWDKAQGWEEYVKQIQLRDQALADKGALANLGDEPVDLGRREFMKGLATEGALAGVKGRAVSKILDEVVSPITEPVVETLPKSLWDLPSLKAAYRGVINTHWRENLDNIMNDDMKEIGDGGLDSLGKSFGDFGVEKGDWATAKQNYADQFKVSDQARVLANKARAAEKLSLAAAEPKISSGQAAWERLTSKKGMWGSGYQEGSLFEQVGKDFGKAGNELSQGTNNLFSNLNQALDLFKKKRPQQKYQDSYLSDYAETRLGPGASPHLYGRSLGR